LLRVYQGFGGDTKTISQAVTDGNLMLEGVFLIDSVVINTDGQINIRARDMMKLLIEQQLFVPLVPTELYPLTYQRFTYANARVNAAAVNSDVAVTTTQPVGDRGATYLDSSGDRWYGFNANIHGHVPTDSLDGDTNTYWLSVGNSSADAPFATDWVEYDLHAEAVNAVYVHPWGGNYTMYVSVMENGAWQGGSVVPYDPSILFATQTPRLPPPCIWTHCSLVQRSSQDRTHATDISRRQQWDRSTRSVMPASNH
jgi:hypothetical protein